MVKHLLLSLLAIQLTHFIFAQSNVGINRTPETTLDIKPIPDGFNFGNAIARLSDTSGTHFLTMRSGSPFFPGTGIIWNGISPFTIGNPIDRISILSDGKVGINRSTPLTNLHIQAADSNPAQMRLSDNSELKELTVSSGTAPFENPYIQWANSDTLRFGTGTNNSLDEKMFIAQNGNMHIEGTIQSDSLSGPGTRPAFIDSQGKILPGSNVAFHVIQTAFFDTITFPAQPILFDSIIVDNTNSFTVLDPPISNAYYTVPEAGMYFISASISHRLITRLVYYIEKDPIDGNPIQALTWGNGGLNNNTVFKGTVTTSTLAYLEAGDKLRVIINVPIGAIITSNTTSFTAFKIW